MREKTTTLRITVSSRAESPSCSMCSKADPVTQHCAWPCANKTVAQGSVKTPVGVCGGRQAGELPLNKACHGVIMS